jgi:hypothetical protein
MAIGVISDLVTTPHHFPPEFGIRFGNVAKREERRVNARFVQYVE